MKDASLAQLVEHDTLNVGVLGSSPRGSTESRMTSQSSGFFVFGCCVVVKFCTTLNCCVMRIFVLCVNRLAYDNRFQA